MAIFGAWEEGVWHSHVNISRIHFVLETLDAEVLCQWSALKLECVCQLHACALQSRRELSNGVDLSPQRSEPTPTFTPPNLSKHPTSRPIHCSPAATLCAGRFICFPSWVTMPRPSFILVVTNIWWAHRDVTNASIPGASAHKCQTP